jgi:hypothetical protein
VFEHVSYLERIRRYACRSRCRHRQTHTHTQTEPQTQTQTQTQTQPLTHGQRLGVPAVAGTRQQRRNLALVVEAESRMKPIEMAPRGTPSPAHTCSRCHKHMSPLRTCCTCKQACTISIECNKHAHPSHTFCTRAEPYTHMQHVQEAHATSRVRRVGHDTTTLLREPAGPVRACRAKFVTRGGRREGGKRRDVCIATR